DRLAQEGKIICNHVRRQLVAIAAAQMGKCQLIFALEQVQRPLRPSLPSGSTAEQRSPADEHSIGPERIGLDHVAATADAAVQEDGRLAPDLTHYRRK